VQDVKNCSFDAWYPDFEKVTLKSIILPIPGPVLDYLKPTNDNGLFLPLECDQDAAAGNDGEEDEDEGDDEEAPSRPSFPEFCLAMRTAICDLGGEVLPKLNWSSPRDAAWMGFARSMKCTTITDVFTLLKSSEFVCHDLTMPFKDCEDFVTSEEPAASQSVPVTSYVLVLRRWSEAVTNRGSEYRCFVRNRTLVGISQRDPTQFYDHIAADKDSIVRDIRTFFKEFIRDKFQSKHYVFDVLRLRKDKVKLIDFNPYGETTDSQLFDWQEDLLRLRDSDDVTMGSDDVTTNVDFRFVESELGIQPGGLERYSLPQDFNDLAEGNDPDKLVDFLKLQGQIQKGQSSDSSDEEDEASSSKPTATSAPPTASSSTSSK